MALRYSFGLGEVADRLDAAIAAVLASGLRTADIRSEGSRVVSTREMGDAIVAAFERGGA
jgi:3-isopropylmalate dehydrogenase